MIRSVLRAAVTRASATLLVTTCPKGVARVWRASATAPLVSIVPQMKRRLATAVVLLLCGAAPASASAATPRPSLAVVGIPSGVIVGKLMPYTQLGSSVELSIAYPGRLPGGAKLELLQKRYSISAFVATRTAIRLAGGRARVHVTLATIGGPVSYEVAVVSGGKRLSTSRAVTVYWAPPPGGVFVFSGSQSAYTSVSNAAESCAGSAPTRPVCKGSESSGQTEQLSAEAGNTPLPPGWKVTLLLNGVQECTTESIEGKCEVTAALPSVGAATVVPVTAEIISPQGSITSATLLVTVYPLG
jgi:hypothetical protein